MFWTHWSTTLGEWVVSIGQHALWRSVAGFPDLLLRSTFSRRCAHGTTSSSSRLSNDNSRRSSEEQGELGGDETHVDGRYCVQV